MEEETYTSVVSSEALDSNNSYKDYYNIFFCPKCYGVLNIELAKNNRVEISCKCYDYEATIIDELGKMNLEELTKFKKYSIPLKNYIIECEKSKEGHYCSMTNNHDKVISRNYCTVCNKWYCNNCLVQHSKYSQEHKVIV